MPHPHATHTGQAEHTWSRLSRKEQSPLHLKVLTLD